MIFFFFLRGVWLSAGRDVNLSERRRADAESLAAVRSTLRRGGGKKAERLLPPSLARPGPARPGCDSRTMKERGMVGGRAGAKSPAW